MIVIYLEATMATQDCGGCDPHVNQSLQCATSRSISPFPYASIRLISGTWATLNQVGLMLSFLIALLLRVITAGTFEKSLTGRVGPKSDRTRVGSTRTSVVPILLGLIFWLHIVPVNSVSADVRVDVDPTRTSEAVTAKHVGYREALQPGNTYDLPRAAKRSYRRAYARSCRQGGAFYKGVWRPHSWYRPVQITTRPVGTTVRPHTNTKALRTLTWNGWRLTCTGVQRACHVRY